MPRKKKTPEETPAQTDAAPTVQPPAEAVTEKPSRPPMKTEENLRVTYTQDQLLEVGKSLANATNELQSVEDEKKSVSASYKARIESIEGKIKDLSLRLSQGWEVKKVIVETRYDTPIAGQKTTVRLDTGETVRIDAMTLSEQGELPLAPVEAFNGVVTVDADSEDEDSSSDQNGGNDDEFFKSQN